VHTSFSRAERMFIILDNIIMTGCSIMHQPGGSERMFIIIDLITECRPHQQGDKEEKMKLHDNFFGMHLWACGLCGLF
jgi:hypothetical protein